MKFHHVAISVRDLEKSAEFYKRFFGFREVNRFERKDLKGKSEAMSFFFGASLSLVICRKR